MKTVTVRIPRYKVTLMYKTNRLTVTSLPVKHAVAYIPSAD